MKLITLILIIAIIQVSATSYAQRITLTKTNASLESVLEEIRKQSGYDCYFDRTALQNGNLVNIRLQKVALDDALKTVFQNQPFTYKIDNKTIIIKEKEKSFFQKVVDAVKAVTIYGKVVDETGKPMPGTIITLKGTKTIAITDNTGTFSIIVNDDKDVLRFTFIGYEAREVQVGRLGKPVVVTMKPSFNNLDQIQVIAYGTTTKRLNTSDVTTITTEEIAKNPVNNVLEALQGKVPGLFIQQTTGQPGSAFSLRLRTASNFNSGIGGAPTPLVVVDGVTYPGAKLPMETNTSYGTGDFLQGGNGLNFLNPNDIESISVLKDADATSLYGASGAYGVILITTKKAKPGPATLNVNVYDGVSLLGQSVKPLSTEQYLMLRREAIKNDGGTIGTSDKDLNGTFPADRNTDFKKELLGSTAQTANLNMTYSGGTQNTNYLVSGSLRNTGNIQRHNGSNVDGSLRFSLNTNSADNKLSYAISGTYLSSVNTMVPYDFSRIMSLTPPNSPDPFLPDGSVNWDSNIVNSAGDINRTYRSVTNNLLANTNLVYRPVQGLSLRANIGYNNISGDQLMGYPTTTLAPTVINAAAQTHSIFHHYQVRDITIEPYAEYAHTFWTKADFNFKLGGKIDNNLSTFDEISGTGFASDALLSNPSVATTIATTYGNTPYRDLGAYAIMKLVWDQKYIINLNGRRDGSTRFGNGNKFGNFGSVAAAWIFSEESFIKHNLKFLSYGKIRASTGIIGGDAIGDFAYLSKYNAVSGTYSGKTILTPGGPANPDLSWEHNKNKEIGVELGFFKDRVFLEGSYYRNIATNQLISVPLTAIAGFTSYPVNTDAVIRTSGWEMSLSTTNVKATNFSWTTRFNMSIPTSKLLKLPTYYTASLANTYVINKPVTGVWLYNFAGINPQTGNATFTKANGVTSDNPSLATADRTEFRDLAPKYYGGFQNTFNYKNFSLDFSFTFTSRLGLNAIAQNGFPVGYNGVNGTAVWLNRWQQPGDVTNVPKLSAGITSLINFSTNYTNSTAAYSNATYARLQNASLRYNFTGSLLSKMHVKSLAVYMQGQNLFTISNYGGLDPENLSITTIPPMRVITGGLNVSF